MTHSLALTFLGMFASWTTEAKVNHHSHTLRRWRMVWESMAKIFTVWGRMPSGLATIGTRCRCGKTGRRTLLFVATKLARGVTINGTTSFSRTSSTGRTVVRRFCADMSSWGMGWILWHLKVSCKTLQDGVTRGVLTVRRPTAIQAKDQRKVAGGR